MKITYQRKNNTVPFSEILIGHMFRNDNNEGLFIKLDAMTSMLVNPVDGSTAAGMRLSWSPDEQVTLVRELIVITDRG